MYAVAVHTAPASRPLTAAELRAHLRLNDAAEDAQLEEWIDAAADQFEADARRPVLATVYRQHVTRWPAELALGRAGVTAVGSVVRTLADGSPETVTGWSADLHTPPARVRLGTVPDPVADAQGRTVSPAGYVEFTAGWADAAAVPKGVRAALKLLAAHYYENREAFRNQSFEMRELPLGWAAVVARYKLGLAGDWGQ